MNTLFIYNSLSKKKEEFIPIKSGYVGMYSCGFTVYDHTHIGHIRKYIGDDVLRRVLEFDGYKVKHVQNVTDVGHLTSDSDVGEDKLEKGARKYDVDIYALAKRFESEFIATMDKVNVLRPTVVERATDPDAIKKQIELIDILLNKGFAYIKDKAIYYDVSKLDNYNPFSNQSLDDKLVGNREDVEIDPEKRNPSDFVLWMFRKGKYENHIMHWDSPWGDGFPGWHIECSAISMRHLGDRIDMHTGGIDHLETHHPNEIAQYDGICGHKVVNYWVHHNYLMVDGRKMSKSLGNFYTIEDIVNRGFDPFALRYLILGTHYRKQLNFTWDALTGASIALNKLRNFISEQDSFINVDVADLKEYKEFVSSINDDLNTPMALSVLWNVVKGDLDIGAKLSLISIMDEILGLKLFDKSKEIDLPEDIEKLVSEREEARKIKDWIKSDEIRNKLEGMGYEVKDGEQCTVKLRSYI